MWNVTPERLTDDRTGRTILRLTSDPAENKLSYYDISPWSPDGREILFSSAPSDSLTIKHRDNLASTKGAVFTMDAETFAIRPVAEGAFFNTHTATHAMWHPDGKRIYFYRAPGVVEAVDRATGQTLLQFEGTLRQFRPDGGKISWTTTRVPAGLYWMNEDGTGVECLATSEELYALTPNRAEFALEEVHLKNAKWSPDGRWLLVANGIWTAPFVNKAGVRRSLFLVNPETGEKKWLCYFGHHHSWAPDSGSIVFCASESSDTREGAPRVWSVDRASGALETVADASLEGHPVANADGSLLVTEDDDGILLVHRAERRVERLAFYLQRFNKTHEGTHSHCAWNPDGSQILYNSAETGPSQLYLIPLNA
ncbi:hypothetical protein BH09VER1_BH09VER1_07440 [soil metagenome]